MKISISRGTLPPPNDGLAALPLDASIMEAMYGRKNSNASASSSTISPYRYVFCRDVSRVTEGLTLLVGHHRMHVGRAYRVPEGTSKAANSTKETGQGEHHRAPCLPHPLARRTRDRTQLLDFGRAFIFIFVACQRAKPNQRSKNARAPPPLKRGENLRPKAGSSSMTSSDSFSRENTC